MYVNFVNDRSHGHHWYLVRVLPSVPPHPILADTFEKSSSVSSHYCFKWKMFLRKAFKKSPRQHAFCAS